MKYIFLDIDGVLNHQKFYKKRLLLMKDNKFGVEYPYSEFCPDSIKWLNKLTDATGAKIVLSSTWRMGRSLQELKDLFNHVGITGELIDKTPILFYAKHKDISLGSVERGKEIDYWLHQTGFSHIFWSKEEQQKYMDKSSVESYCILDDDSDMLYNQRNHFCHIPPMPRHSSGFDEKHYKIALNILSKNIIELNYAA